MKSKILTILFILFTIGSIGCSKDFSGEYLMYDSKGDKAKYWEKIVLTKISDTKYGIKKYLILNSGVDIIESEGELNKEWIKEKEISKTNFKDPDGNPYPDMTTIYYLVFENMKAGTFAYFLEMNPNEKFLGVRTTE